MDLVSPTPFVEETLFSHILFLAFLSKISYMWIYFQTLYYIGVHVCLNDINPCDLVLTSCCCDLLSSSLLVSSLAWVEHILLLLHETGYVESRFLKVWMPPNVFIFFWYLINMVLLHRILGWIHFPQISLCCFRAIYFAVQKTRYKWFLITGLWSSFSCSSLYTYSLSQVLKCHNYMNWRVIVGGGGV